jgi:Zn-finger nucleic acid-binding protein
MKCPVDSATLIMAERSGVEIDYCPECRGIWLDRGELDKIIQGASREQDRYTSESSRRHDDDEEPRSHPNHDRGYADNKKNKRGSFIGDIFGGFGDD